MAPIIVARYIETAFSHKTKSGIFNAGNKANINVSITVPGASLLSFTFHETSRRNATVHFRNDDLGLYWTGETETDSSGGSGNFEGVVKATFAKVEVPISPSLMSSFNGFVSKDLGTFSNVSDFYKSELKLSSNLLALNDALGGDAAVATRDVDSASQSWHAAVNLPGGKYLVVPSPDSRWAISGGAGGSHDFEFHGTGDFDGTLLGIPLNPMRLAGLAGVLFVITGGTSSPVDVFQFPPGKNSHVLNVPSQGGQLSFIIGDKPGTYGDNHGTCKVAVFKTE